MTYAQAAKLQPNEIVLLKSNGAQFKVKSIEFDPDNKIVFIRDSDDKMHHCSELEFPKTSTGRKNSVYVRTLIAKVINASEADNWENAVQEWAIAGCIEDKSKSHSCICGKEELVYLFTIRNEINGNILFPIGSSCIKKFEREDLSEQAALHEQMFKLYHAVESGRFISLNSEYFSRKVLKHLYDVGAFNTIVSTERSITSSCSRCSTSVTRRVSPKRSIGRFGLLLSRPSNRILKRRCKIRLPLLERGQFFEGEG